MDIIDINRLITEYKAAGSVAEKRDVLARAVRELSPADYLGFLAGIDEAPAGERPAADSGGGFLDRLKGWLEQGVSTGVFDPGAVAPQASSAPIVLPTQQQAATQLTPGQPDGGGVVPTRNQQGQALTPTASGQLVPSAAPAAPSEPTSVLEILAGVRQAPADIANRALLQALGIRNTDTQTRIIDWYKSRQEMLAPSGQQTSISLDIEAFRSMYGATNSQLADYFIDISNGINRTISNFQAPTSSEWRYVLQDDGSLKWTDTPGITDSENQLILNENGERFFYNPEMPEMFLEQMMAGSEAEYLDYVDQLILTGWITDPNNQPEIVVATQTLLEQANQRGRSVDVILSEMEGWQETTRSRVRASVSYTPEQNVRDVGQQTAFQFLGRVLEDAEISRLMIEYQRLERTGVLEAERARMEAQTGVSEFDQIQALSDFASSYIRRRFRPEMETYWRGVLEDEAIKEYGEQVLLLPTGQVMAPQVTEPQMTAPVQSAAPAEQEPVPVGQSGATEGGLRL